jgi:SAM-dependent methyltransferase
MTRGMNTTNQDDTWASGAAYESYVGRWSRLVAQEFLAWLDVPSGSRWLDVGCGTGSLSRMILEMASPSGVRGVDPSAGFVVYVRKQVNHERARFEVGDARALPYAAATFEAVVSGLVLNFVPEPAVAAAEMARVARPGGTVAAYIWDYAGEMQMMRYFWDAAVALDPSARDLDEGRRFPLCKPGPLTEVFRGTGLTDVAVRPIDVRTYFRDFDEYWSPFLGGQGPAPGYVASLSEAGHAALKERVRASVPIAPDGSLDLIARAWAVRGTA